MEHSGVELSGMRWSPLFGYFKKKMNKIDGKVVV
jgi:hypothetical protein